jgi:hypothetical protein
MKKDKLSFDEARKLFKQLEPELIRRETKAEGVARKQRESAPLELQEARKLGLRDLRKSADRLHYDMPVNRQAAKELKRR